ncbi:MAG: hypothetical protein ACU826_08395, partial [Gammaproteobacteria bacterium]
MINRINAFANKGALLSLIFAMGALLDSPAYALLSDAAVPWSAVDGASGDGGVTGGNWQDYLFDGEPARDAEGGGSSDGTNGGSSFSGDTDIASGWSGVDSGCNPTTAGTRCGTETSAFFYIDEATQTLFLRMRLNGNPGASSGNGFGNDHWNFLLDVDRDGYKEMWIDLHGNGLPGSGVSLLRVIYNNDDTQTIPNEKGAGTAGDACNGAGNATTDGSGTVVNSFLACYAEGLGGACAGASGADLSHARRLAIPGSAGVSKGTEYFIDVQAPLAALTKGDGCYSAPRNLTDTEVFEAGSQIEIEHASLWFSTSNSAVNPLQKDFIGSGFGNSFNPVSVAYFSARHRGGDLIVDWTTATETSNAGFNLYAVVLDEWIPLNETLIRGALDSLEPRNYRFRIANPYGHDLQAIGIAGVDIDGEEDRHGPFPVGKPVGNRPEVVEVNWAGIRKSVEAVLH